MGGIRFDGGGVSKKNGRMWGMHPPPPHYGKPWIVWKDKNSREVNIGAGDYLISISQSRLIWALYCSWIMVPQNFSKCQISGFEMCARVHVFILTCDVLPELVPCAQFKNVANTHGGVLFTKSNTPAWVFFTFFKLYKWYQIAQSISYVFRSLIIMRKFFSASFSNWKTVLLEKICK